MMLVGWSDTAFRPHEQDGRRRPGYIIGLTSPTLTGPAHLLQLTSRLIRKQVTRSLGGGIFALSAMWDHKDMVSKFYVGPGREKIRS